MVVVVVVYLTFFRREIDGFRVFVFVFFASL